jgi:hypothetical protein
MRVARTERALDQMLVQITHDEEAIEAAHGLAADYIAGALEVDQKVPRGRSARPASGGR